MDENKVNHEKTVGRYELQPFFRRGNPSEFCRGGNSRIYRARVISYVDAPVDLPNEVAIKIAWPQSLPIDKYLPRFRQEGEIGKTLRHPNIVPFYESGSGVLNGKTVYFHILGLGRENLSAFVHRRKNERNPISVHEALEIGEQIGKAIDFAHQHKVVLRDLKPDNILIFEDGLVKIGDFDNAWIVDGPGARDRVGTTIFAPPEHFPDPNLPSRPFAVPASDIFSFGKLLFFLLANDYPRGVDSQPINELPAELNEQPWSDEVSRILHAATRVDPSSRYQSAVELVEDLRSVIAESPALAEGEATADEDFIRKLLARRRARRRRRRRLASAIVVIAVFAMFAFSALVIQKQLLVARVPKPHAPCATPTNLSGLTIISKTKVNVRAGPSTQAQILCTMNAGTPALVLGQTTNKWAKVRITHSGTSPESSCLTETEGYSNVEYFEVKCP